MVTPAGTFSYLYENDGRLSSLTNPSSETSSWSYLDNGWLQKQTLGNGANANWTYNARGFVTRLQNLTGASTTLSDFGGAGGILSDSLGNPTSLPANVPGSTAASGTTSYTYNTQDELTQEQSARNGSYTDNFGYDPAFNPTTWKGSTQTFNSDNQNTAFVFDGNGNPTSYQGNTLSWDAQNRLAALAPFPQLRSAPFGCRYRTVAIGIGYNRTTTCPIFVRLWVQVMCTSPSDVCMMAG